MCKLDVPIRIHNTRCDNKTSCFILYDTVPIYHISFVCLFFVVVVVVVVLPFFSFVMFF